MMLKQTSLILALMLATSGVSALAQTTAPQTTEQLGPDAKPAAAQADYVMETSPNAVQRVMNAGLMNGYPDGNFHAEGMLTRAELAHILVKTFKLESRQPRIAGMVMTQDVPTTHWAYNDIQTVLKGEIMEGYRENQFYPNQKVSRAEAFAIMAQAYGVFSWDDATVAEELAPYPDAAQIPAWAEKAMATALHEGFVNTGEMAGRIYPAQPMTRGDMAYALTQYLDRLGTPPTERVPAQ